VLCSLLVSDDGVTFGDKSVMGSQLLRHGGFRISQGGLDGGFTPTIRTGLVHGRLAKVDHIVLKERNQPS